MIRSRRAALGWLILGLVTMLAGCGPGQPQPDIAETCTFDESLFDACVFAP